MTDRKLLVFDFDGTLVESATQYATALKEFSDIRGLPHDATKMAHGYTHPETHDLGWGIALNQQPALLAELNEWFYNEVVTANRFMSTVFPNTMETLEALEGVYDFSIVTARDRRSLKATLEYYGMEKYFPIFRTLCCATERGYSIKPAADAIHCVIAESGHDLPDIVVIGDTTADIEMAHNAGVKSIAALWGAHPKEKLAACSPTIMLDDISELPASLTKLFN